jgi:hypothetical protein
MNPYFGAALGGLLGYALSRKNPSSCPRATQDLKLNTKNRNAAIRAKWIQYGPLNLADKSYWRRLARHWNTTPEVAMQSRCANCVAFDISPRMIDCMTAGPISENIEDADGVLGYCWMHHFKCHSARSCYTWAAGGPITSDRISKQWQAKSSSV